MKNKIFTVYLLLCSISTHAAAPEKWWIPHNLDSFIAKELNAFATSPELVEAVKRKNAEPQSLDDIKARDKVWRETNDLDTFMWSLMRNNCAFLLARLENKYHFIVESFVMDRQGALVCTGNKTSDYWQGDEAKFSVPYLGGKGTVHYSDVEYDASSDEILLQISLPVTDAEKTIGAITFGINLEKWERR